MSTCHQVLLIKKKNIYMIILAGVSRYTSLKRTLVSKLVFKLFGRLQAKYVNYVNIIVAATIKKKKKINKVPF